MGPLASQLRPISDPIGAASAASRTWPRIWFQALTTMQQRCCHEPKVNFWGQNILKTWRHLAFCSDNKLIALFIEWIGNCKHIKSVFDGQCHIVVYVITWPCLWLFLMQRRLNMTTININRKFSLLSKWSLHQESNSQDSIAVSLSTNRRHILDIIS